MTFRKTITYLKAATRLPFCCNILFAGLFITLGLSSTTCAAQDRGGIEMTNAYKAFLEKRYFSAALLYKRSYDKLKDQEMKDSAAFMIAESYRQANNLKLAFRWFETTVNTRYPNPEVLFLYGQALKNYERYDEAAKAFYDYNFEMPASRSRGEREIKACEQARKWKSEPTRYELKNISALNSESSDYCPFIMGDKIYFSSARANATGNVTFEWTGQKCSDIFYSDLQSGSWTKPSILPGAVNSAFNEGASCVDAAGNTLYYTQCNGSDGKGISCNILVSRKTPEGWTKGEMLSFCSEDFSTGQPSLSSNGLQLFFSSDMPGGYGAHDIYVVERETTSGKWKAPRNLGPAINTADDEMFPSFATGGILYFSSKGHSGMGGFDIFSTRFSDGAWSQPENLKYPLNSGGDDFNLVFLPGYEQIEAGKPVGYMASNRLSGQGDDDIYEIRMRAGLQQLEITVKDKETGVLLPESQIRMDPAKSEFITDSLGVVRMVYSRPAKNSSSNSMDVSHEGYYLYHYEIPDIGDAAGDTTLSLLVMLERIPEKEKEIVLEGIFYDLDKYNLRDESKKILDSLIIILQQNPGIAVEIASHTDSRSDSAYNYVLSQKRAQSCVDYLIGRGINKDRLTAVGYGESRPVNNCRDGVPCSEEQHQENRRTGFRIISTDYRGR